MVFSKSSLLKEDNSGRIAFNHKLIIIFPGNVRKTFLVNPFSNKCFWIYHFIVFITRMGNKKDKE